MARRPLQSQTSTAPESESERAPAPPPPPSAQNGAAPLDRGVSARIARRVPQLGALARSDTGRAAGLAGAMMGNNLIALVTTVLFARLLGASGYGTLGALLAAFVILMVPGSALQATVAREVSHELGEGSEVAGAGVHRWMTHLTIALAVVVALAVFLREQIAAAIGVEVAWAAAATLPTGWLWLMLSVQRGALQAVQRYRLVGLTLVGEAALRLVFGVALLLLGFGVTGAFLGTTIALALLVVAYTFPLRRLLPAPRDPAARAAVPGMRRLIARARIPVVAFVLLAILQHVDVIIVKHVAAPDVAGAYVAASVAAKAVIWLAMGLGFYLLPEAVRRTQRGDDARPILVRTLALLAVVAVPLVAFYSVLAQPLLELVFRAGLTAGAGALPLLTAAMALLGVGYLGVQYLLALGRRSFLALLASAAAVELVVLPNVGAGSRGEAATAQLVDVALVLLCLQTVLTVALLWSAARARSAQRTADALLTPEG